MAAEPAVVVDRPPAAPTGPAGDWRPSMQPTGQMIDGDHHRGGQGRDRTADLPLFRRSSGLHQCVSAGQTRSATGIRTCWISRSGSLAPCWPHEITQSAWQADRVTWSVEADLGEVLVRWFSLTEQSAAVPADLIETPTELSTATERLDAVQFACVWSDGHHRAHPNLEQFHRRWLKH